MSFRFESPRRTRSLAASLLVSCAFACSDSKDDDTQSTTNGQQPQATETNVTMPTMLGNDGPAPTDDTAVCQTAAFCDGFESATAAQPPGAPWTAVQTNGTVVVDTARAFRGTQAVKATTLATAVSGQTYKRALIGLGAGSPVIPVPNDAFYGRMMFYLESVPEASLHWTFIDATGRIPGQDYNSTYRYGGQLPITEAGAFKGNQLMANYDTLQFYSTPSVGPNTDCYQHANATVVPVGKWSCAEWYFDGANNRMKFWLDGTEISSLAIDGKGAGCTGADARDVPDYPWTGPTFAQIDVGWESYAADDERTIWIDDVVISQTQVGCPAPASASTASTPNTMNAGPNGY